MHIQDMNMHIHQSIHESIHLSVVHPSAIHPALFCLFMLCCVDIVCFLVCLCDLCQRRSKCRCIQGAGVLTAKAGARGLHKVRAASHPHCSNGSI